MFTIDRRIEFRDTDAAGIAHFSVFFPMMEVAEHELLRSLGMSVVPEKLRSVNQPTGFEENSEGVDSDNHASDNLAADNLAADNHASDNLASDNLASDNLAAKEITWPRVSAHCDYCSVARFEDLLKIAVSVKSLGNSSVQYSFRFTRQMELSAEVEIARGSLTAVCCELAAGGVLTKIRIPDRVRRLLSQHFPG